MTTANGGVEATKAIDGARIGELDGFRGAAVLSIVFLHFVVHHLDVTPSSPIAYAQKYFMFLWVGVDAFFVLSGYLIGGILIDRKKTSNYFCVFYLRRSLRIFPLYFFLLFLWLAIRGANARPGMEWLLAPSFPQWPYLLYVQNFWMAMAGSTGPNFVAATWSLAVEEQFYLLFPLLIWWSSKSALPIVLSVGILSAPALRLAMALLGPDWENAQIVLLPARWDSLLFGALVAWATRDAKIMAQLTLRRRSLLVLLGFLFVLMLAWPLLLNVPNPGLSAWRAALVHLSVAMFFGLVLLLMRLRSLPRITRVLSGNALRFFGKISYFIYLFHTAALGLCFALVLGKAPILRDGIDWAVMLGALVLTVGLGQASWRWLEAPLVAMGHKVRYAARQPAAQGVAS